MSAFLPSKRAFNSFSRGFTLIELLIVIAIIAVLVVIALSRVGNFGDQVELNTASQKIVSTLEIARNQTLASEDESVYGVHFEGDKYVLFKGSSYDSLDPENKVYDLTKVEIYDTAVTGGSDVIFDRIRGTTSNSGDIKIRLLADPSKAETIVINPLGQSSLQQTVSSPVSRVTDTRHVHLDFGWSMQSSNTMRLVFSDPPNPNVTEDIDIQTNIVSGKFNWTDTVDVNGDEEELRIHSHLLNGSDTILSIHRDRSINNKALEIQVDGTTVVTFDAGGSVTAGFVDQLIVQ